MKDKINIGLIGYGNVGKGIVDYFLNSGNPELQGYDLSVVGVKDLSKQRPFGGIRLTSNITRDIIENPEINIVVDAVGGNGDANQSSLVYITNSLTARKNVVTCNKAVVSNSLGLFSNLAQNKGVNFQYEAAVCGGIPIIRTLKEYFRNDSIEKIVGIINGTSNYILTQMHSGKTYEEALKEAQEKGYAESDPTSDVGGMDATYKLAILASLAFRTEIKPRNIITEGIQNVTHHDIFYVQNIMSARERKKHSIRSLAIAELNEGNLELRVHPAYIDEDHPLFGTNDAINRVCIQGKYSGVQTLGGPGAGSSPTGFAVVSDIFEVGRKIRAGIVDNFLDLRRKYEITRNPTTRGYIKSSSPQHQTNVFAKKAAAIGEQSIDIRDITNCTEFEQENNGHSVPDMFLIEDTPENRIAIAAERMRETGCVEGPVVYIREDKLEINKK